MAYIGLRKPYVGKWTADGKYETPVLCGKAIAFDISPNYAEATLNGDDSVAENVREFTSADLTLGTTYLPTKIYEIMFGHTVTEASEGKGANVKFNANDSAEYVGIGIIQPQMIDGKKTYQAMFIYKAKFSEPSESYETKGDSITFGTPSISGNAYAQEDGNWREKEDFDTEASAIEWITKKFTPAA